MLDDRQVNDFFYISIPIQHAVLSNYPNFNIFTAYPISYPAMKTAPWNQQLE